MQHSRSRLHGGDFTDFGVHARHCNRQTCELAVIQARNEKNEQVIDEEELEDEIIKAPTLIDEFTICRKTANAMTSKVKTARTRKHMIQRCQSTAHLPSQRMI